MLTVGAGSSGSFEVTVIVIVSVGLVKPTVSSGRVTSTVTLTSPDLPVFSAASVAVTSMVFSPSLRVTILLKLPSGATEMV